MLSKLGMVMTSIANLSLSTGTFGNVWKTITNRKTYYRPVSNLPFISKVVEKNHMLRQFTAHCGANKLLPGYQSAYRTNFSCETALVKLQSDILWSMEKQRITAIIAIDLSAAFDTVDHNILLDVLNNQFGISHTALKWYYSYLRPRSFKMNVGSAYSTCRPLAFSVP